jgi:flagellar basal body-associated protein FliL
LIIFALIFGSKKRKKGKGNYHYRIATAGFILGIIGIILSVPIGIGIISVYKMIDSSKSGINLKYRRNIPKHAVYDKIGLLTLKMKDTKNYIVKVNLIILCDADDNETGTELDSRLYELHDFIQSYFSEKSVSELVVENEKQLKLDIVETLNTKFLCKNRIRLVLFNQLDVLENE